MANRIKLRLAFQENRDVMTRLERKGFFYGNLIMGRELDLYRTVMRAAMQDTCTQTEVAEKSDMVFMAIGEQLGITFEISEAVAEANRAHVCNCKR